MKTSQYTKIKQIQYMIVPRLILYKQYKYKCIKTEMLFEYVDCINIIMKAFCVFLNFGD